MSAEEQHYGSLAQCDLDYRLMADINSHSETEEDEDPAWCPPEVMTPQSIAEVNKKGEKSADIIEGKKPALCGTSTCKSTEQEKETPAKKQEKSKPEGQSRSRLSMTPAFSKKLNSIKSSSWSRCAERSLSEDASCPIVSSISEESQDLERDPSVRAHLKQKMHQLSAQLQVEEAQRDEDTIEYLQLIAHADLKQAAQARTVFEKRDEQRSAAIDLLQCHLQVCKRTLLDLHLHHLNKHLNNLHMEREYKLDDLQESHHQANLQDKSLHVDPNQESRQENTFGELSTDSTSDKDVKLQEMAHQSSESTTDIVEGMESFEGRIPKQEIKCNTQVDVDVEETPDELQSYERCNTQVDVDVEETPDELLSYGSNNSNGQVDVEETPDELQSNERFLRIVLVILAIVLVFISPVCLCALPLIEICMRTMGTTPLVVALMFILQNWDTILTQFGNG